MASYTVRCYNNTGFDAKNIPASPAVLNQSGESSTFPAVWLYQNYDLGRISIAAEWSTVRDVDYIQIGAVYYFVLGVAMETESTATFTISMDYITTAGGFSQLGITDGWCKRAHSPTDALFENILSEPWAPSEDLIIDGIEMLPPDLPFTQLPIVGATVDLEQTDYTAREYKNGSGEVVVSVPEVPTIVTGTRIDLRHNNEYERSYTIPNLRLYDLGNTDIYQGIQAVRSLGLDDAITASYLLPSVAVESFNLQGASYQWIKGARTALPATNLPYQYSTTVKNKKVYALHNNYTILSICSGDQERFPAHELYSAANPTNPVFTYFTDCSPQGAPYIQPSTYKGITTTPFMQSIRGLNWQSTPINFGSQKSGSLLDNVSYERSRNRDITNAAFDTAIGAANIVRDTSKAASADVLGLFSGENAVSRTADAVGTGLEVAQQATNTLLDFRENYANYIQDQRINTPEIRFPIQEGVQNFIGNNFTVYRTRLAPADVVRMDRFFTMYGYAQDKQLQMTDFTNRQYFNYVQAEGINITANLGLRHRAGVIAALEGGIRVWHVPVNPSYYTDNPIRTTGG